MSLQEKIEAKETPISNLFSENFIFNIPVYQRPFSWTVDNFDELYNDISNLFENPSVQYFLGSILLQETNKNTYDIVDGQQRITALTILFAVIRDNTNNSDLKEKIGSYIYQEADSFKEIPEVMRITPWSELQDLFKDYIYKNGGTTNFLNDFETKIKYRDQEDPRYHIYEAIHTFKNKIDVQSDLETFVRYLLNRVFVVYIKATSRTSAFRLFSVMNSRGLPLDTSDLLKSEMLEAIPDNIARDKYAGIWRDIEEDIGREELSNVIAYIRTIKTKEKAQLSMYDEFQQIFKNHLLVRGIQFIEFLKAIVDIYNKNVLEKEIDSNDHEKNNYKITMDLLQRFIPFSDWVAPLLAFCYKFTSDKNTMRLLQTLEKKVVLEWISGYSYTERITSLNKILTIIDEANDSEEVLQKIDIPKRNNIESIFQLKLNDKEFYSIYGGKLAKYLLLRLDKELWELENFPGYPGTITVEHILPQNPAVESKWLSHFNKIQRENWTNRLGNLVLLSSRKNSKAQNYDFGNKKRIYFDQKGTAFKITQQVKDHKTWDPTEIKLRHDKLIMMAKDIFLS